MCVVPFLPLCFPRAGINGVHCHAGWVSSFLLLQNKPLRGFVRRTASTTPGPVANMLPPCHVRILSVLPSRITLVLWSQVRIPLKEALLWVTNEVMPASVFGILDFQAGQSVAGISDGACSQFLSHSLNKCTELSLLIGRHAHGGQVCGFLQWFNARHVLKLKAPF